MGNTRKEHTCGQHEEEMWQSADEDIAPINMMRRESRGTNKMILPRRTFHIPSLIQKKDDKGIKGATDEYHINGRLSFANHP